MFIAKPFVNDSWDNSSSNNIFRGNSSFWRFYLDVPGAQPPGTYRNQVNFKGVQTGNSCGPIS